MGVLVEYKKCYSASAFDHDFNASDKIRELLKEMRIGTGMPLGTNDLTSCLRKIDENLKNIDGPQALTTIRNLVVHPKKAKRERLGELSKMALYQALDLGLYYLELILLRLLGYTGAYYNRFI